MQMKWRKNQEHSRILGRGINSKGTLCNYTDYLKKFINFHEIKGQYEKVVTFDTKKIDNLISDYLDSLIERKLKR